MTTISRVRERWTPFYDRNRVRLKVAVGVILTLVTVLAIVSAVVLHSTRAHDEALAVQSCQRSQEFGPQLVTFYAAHHVLSAASLHLYQQTIPKHC